MRHRSDLQTFFILIVSWPQNETCAQLCDIFMVVLSKVEDQQRTSLFQKVV